MILIGIDFSINSPAICVNIDDDRLKLISFFNTGGSNWGLSKSKKWDNHKTLMGNDLATVIPYTRQIDQSSYVDEQKSKMKEAIDLSNLIIDTIKPYKDMGEVKVGLEGFSYGSTGQSYIDLIMFNSFLRKDLVNVFGYDNIYIVSPTDGKKKFSGKGNATKDVMIDAFLHNYIQSPLIEKLPLYNFYKDKQIDYRNIKPIDDIIDSIGIMNAVQQYIK